VKNDQKFAEIMAAPVRLPHDIYPTISLITREQADGIRPGMSNLLKWRFKHVVMYQCPNPEQWLFDCFTIRDESGNNSFLLFADELQQEQAELVAQELSARLEKIRVLEMQ
jgi:hypothetical protein